MFPAPVFHLEIVEECGSTNEELLQRREDSQFPGLALLALRQTGGHGRRGNTWWSGEGNLCLSLGFRLDKNLETIALLPFLLGLAAMDVLVPLVGNQDLQLKWPNDIYLKGKKLAGILSQARQSAAGADLVLGIGLNLQKRPPDLEAIALGDLVRAPAPQEFALLLLRAFEQRLRDTKDFPTLRAQWELAAKLQESSMCIGGEEGVVRGLRLLPTGELEVENAAGGRRVLSSETVSVRFTPPSA